MKATITENIDLKDKLKRYLQYDRTSNPYPSSFLLHFLLVPHFLRPFFPAKMVSMFPFVILSVSFLTSPLIPPPLILELSLCSASSLFPLLEAREEHDRHLQKTNELEKRLLEAKLKEQVRIYCYQLD